MNLVLAASLSLSYNCPTNYRSSSFHESKVTQCEHNNRTTPENNRLVEDDLLSYT